MKILKGRINDLEGFVIQDLLEPKKAALTIPPFLTRKWSLQLTSKNVLEWGCAEWTVPHLSWVLSFWREHHCLEALPAALASLVHCGD